ncbi:MAG: type II toxin-antitoxin system VapB family antitoxin [Candidatus Methylomirabilia bacterium]
MRLTLTVDKELLEEVVRLAGTRTKREAFELALREFIRHRRLEEIISHGGNVDLAISVEDLLKAREES